MSKTVTRAVVLPVKWPADKDAQKALAAKINPALDRARAVANHAQAEMWRATLAHFGQLGPDDKPSPQDGDAYRIACQTDAGQRLPGKTVSCIVQSVRSRWRGRNSRGLKVWWSVIHGQQTLPTQRNVPYPIHPQQSWQSKSRRPHLGRGGEAFIWAPVGYLDEGKLDWIELQLQHKDKAGDRRAYHTFCAMVEGACKGREIQLFLKAGGRLMVKFVVDVPVKDRGERNGTLLVATRPDALWAASHRGRPRDWFYNAQHIHELLQVMDRKQVRDQRLREDMKAEARRKGAGRGPAARMRRESIKQRDRVNTALHTAAKSLVNYADRKNMARIVYDDSCRDLAPTFPWSELALRVKEKAAAAGIELVTADAHRDTLAKQKAEDELLKINLYLASLQKGSTDDDPDASES
jgi:hypothetical protein